MRYIQSALSTLVVSAGLVAGCSSDGKDCDAGQVMQNNVCVPATSGTGGSGGTGGSAGGGTGGTDGSAGGQTDTGTQTDTGAAGPTWGTTCTTSGANSPECAAPASYCGIQPGTSSGYCTALDCKTNTTLCPSGWTCFDVGVMNFCMKP